MLNGIHASLYYYYLTLFIQHFSTCHIIYCHHYHFKCTSASLCHHSLTKVAASYQNIGKQSSSLASVNENLVMAVPSYSGLFKFNLPYYNMIRISYGECATDEPFCVRWTSICQTTPFFTRRLICHITNLVAICNFLWLHNHHTICNSKDITIYNATYTPWTAEQTNTSLAKHQQQANTQPLRHTLTAIICFCTGGNFIAHSRILSQQIDT